MVCSRSKGTICSSYVGQECQNCNIIAQPRYSRDDMTKMAEYAVDRYLMKIGRLPWPSKKVDAPVVVTDRPPHDEGRCEMCKALGRSCWKNAAVVQQQRELEEVPEPDDDQYPDDDRYPDGNDQYSDD